MVSEMLISTCGVIYCTSWMIAFYPQIYENYMNKNVFGFSIDFAFLSFFAFIPYFLYTLIGYMYPSFNTGMVEIEDILFAANGTILTFIMCLQSIFYPKRPGQGVSPLAILYVCFLYFVGLSLFISETFFDYYISDKYNFLLWFGMCKTLTMFFKYIPQVVLNYTRKSTHGFSVYMIILDIIGATFSTFQLLLRCNDPFEVGCFNIAKFCLSIVGFSFDCIFLTQHYLLYSELYTKQQSFRLDSFALDDSKIHNPKMIQFVLIIVCLFACINKYMHPLINLF